MNPNESSPQPSKDKSQLLDLVKVVVTVLLTGVLGGAITYYYQDRAQQKQQETKELETSRESTVAFLKEFGDILETRKYLTLKCLYAFRDNMPAAEREELWKTYTESVTVWNRKWNLYRALTLKELGPAMQKRFYDEAGDDKGPLVKLSITGKLIVLHKHLLDTHRKILAGQSIQDVDKDEALYTSLAEDCFSFYSDVIAHIQEGRVGRRAWPTANK